MKLVITTPLAVAVDLEEVVSVRAEDETGGFGLWRGHADFLTALTPSVVSWRLSNGREGHCAVRGGVLSVSSGTLVSIATREAVTGDDLKKLETEVVAHFRREREEEVGARAGSERLHLAAIRRIIEYLRPRRGAGMGPPGPPLERS